MRKQHEEREAEAGNLQWNQSSLKRLRNSMKVKRHKRWGEGGGGGGGGGGEEGGGGGRDRRDAAAYAAAAAARNSATARSGTMGERGFSSSLLPAQRPGPWFAAAIIIFAAPWGERGGGVPRVSCRRERSRVSECQKTAVWRYYTTSSRHTYCTSNYARVLASSSPTVLLLLVFLVCAYELVLL